MHRLTSLCIYQPFCVTAALLTHALASLRHGRPIHARPNIHIVTVYLFRTAQVVEMIKCVNTGYSLKSDGMVCREYFASLRDIDYFVCSCRLSLQSGHRLF